MAIQAIYSLAPSAPAAPQASLVEVEGGFYEALALAIADPPPIAPPLASPPGVAGESEKEGVLPTLPNATGTKLDFFLPTENYEQPQDELLASSGAVSLLPAPILVFSSPIHYQLAPSLRPVPAIEVGALAKGHERNTSGHLSLTTLVSSPAVSVPTVSVQQIPTLFVSASSLPALESAPLVFVAQGAPKPVSDSAPLHFGSPAAVSVTPSSFRPAIAMPEVAAAASSEPMVKLEGLIRQASPQSLDPAILKEIGLQAMRQTVIPTALPTSHEPAPEHTENGVRPVSVSAPANLAPVAQSTLESEIPIIPVLDPDPTVKSVVAPTKEAQAPPLTAVDKLRLEAEQTALDHLDSPDIVQPVAVAKPKTGLSTEPLEDLVTPPPVSAPKPVAPSEGVKVDAQPAAHQELSAPETPASDQSAQAPLEIPQGFVAPLEDEAVQPQISTDAEPVKLTSEVGATAPAQPQIAADKAAGQPPLPVEVQRDALKQTVERIEQMAINRPLTQMVIRLTPEELGSVFITVKTRGVWSEAEITVSNERLAVALETARPQLVQAVESKGVGLSQLTLQHGDGQTGQGSSQPQREDFQRAQQFFQSHRPETVSTAISARPEWGLRATTLDLVI